MGWLSRNSYNRRDNASAQEPSLRAIVGRNSYGLAAKSRNTSAQATADRNSYAGFGDGLDCDNEIRDELGRKFRTLRLSLTPHCNFACSYCVPGILSGKTQQGRGETSRQINHRQKDFPARTKNQKKRNTQNSPRNTKNASLPPEAYAKRVERIHQITPLQTVRLTGGEPLLYKKIEELIILLKEIGIPEIKLTTNAYLLEKKASSLQAAGLHSLNISLDALSEKSFRRISPLGNLGAVLRGIEAALDAGLSLKLNATIMNGQNEDQILPLLEFARRRNIRIRFLEVMKMGHLARHHDSVFFSQAQILEAIQSRYEIRRLPREAGATANYWQILGTPFVFGIIANHSESFCGDCHRLRMDSHGNLYGCLSSPVGFRMPETSEAKAETELREVLRRCLAQKRRSFSGSEISMKAIGG